MIPLISPLKRDETRTGAFWQHFKAVLPEFARAGDILWAPKTCLLIGILEAEDLPCAQERGVYGTGILRLISDGRVPTVRERTFRNAVAQFNRSLET